MYKLSTNSSKTADDRVTMTQQRLNQTDSNKNSQSANDSKRQSIKSDNSSQTRLTNSSPGSITDPKSDIIPYLQKQQRLGFVGLTDANSKAYPDEVADDFPGRSSEPYAFTDIIDILPDAEHGELESINQFVNPNGDIDANKIEETLDTDLDNLVDRQPNNGVRRHTVDEYTEIIDPRRQALAALGYDTKYRWQIATNSYTIINPNDAYYSAYKTFLAEGEEDNVFGWVDIRDWGGNIDLYILFENQRLPIPNRDKDGFLGIQTGYDYRGGRTLEAQIFGYDPNKGTRLYRIGSKRSRRHQGNPTNNKHERENNRTPITEWWEEEYKVITQERDELFEDIKQASEIVIDFTEFEFTVKEFYKYLGIPDSYVTGTNNTIGAVERADQYSSPSPQYTIWTLYHALATTLEREFQGENHAGPQFKVYADLTRGLLRSPERTIQRIQDEYHEQSENSEDTESIDILDKADNVEVSLRERRDTVTENQSNLLAYSEPDNN